MLEGQRRRITRLSEVRLKSLVEIKVSPACKLLRFFLLCFGPEALIFEIFFPRVLLFSRILANQPLGILDTCEVVSLLHLLRLILMLLPYLQRTFVKSKVGDADRFTAQHLVFRTNELCGRQGIAIFVHKS